MSPFRVVRVDETWDSAHETQDLQDLRDASYSVQVLDQGMILSINVLKIKILWKQKLKQSK